MRCENHDAGLEQKDSDDGYIPRAKGSSEDRLQQLKMTMTCRGQSKTRYDDAAYPRAVSACNN